MTEEQIGKRLQQHELTSILHGISIALLAYQIVRVWRTVDHIVDAVVDDIAA